MRLDQRYLRSQPVNSEEGAPMGIGIWYEMFISDPVAYLFKNADPRGSLRANVSASVIQRGRPPIAATPRRTPRSSAARSTTPCGWREASSARPRKPRMWAARTKRAVGRAPA